MQIVSIARIKNDDFGNMERLQNNSRESLVYVTRHDLNLFHSRRFASRVYISPSLFLYTYEYFVLYDSLNRSATLAESPQKKVASQNHGRKEYGLPERYKANK
ncbi:unnamed protein product [Lepeophtheirus salmonis]|uniref:(salmon louse) hypothetical protein n=1 Tax=Lepeophtheirus salmonis TaxID=72036 RepID=A0A7R8HA30_LEPSM|nr:unnamed protein product [Lepeophtheirus salmonis]CAF2966542.1 unnamed protein product [Lepeophtheirus salmonis]